MSPPERRPAPTLDNPFPSRRLLSPTPPITPPIPSKTGRQVRPPTPTHAGSTTSPNKGKTAADDDIDRDTITHERTIAKAQPGSTQDPVLPTLYYDNRMTTAAQTDTATRTSTKTPALLSRNRKRAIENDARPTAQTLARVWLPRLQLLRQLPCRRRLDESLRLQLRPLLHIPSQRDDGWSCATGYATRRNFGTT